MSYKTHLFSGTHLIQLPILGKTVWADGLIWAVGGKFGHQGALGCFAGLNSLNFSPINYSEEPEILELCKSPSSKLILKTFAPERLWNVLTAKRPKLYIIPEYILVLIIPRIFIAKVV